MACCPGRSSPAPACAGSEARVGRRSDAAPLRPACPPRSRRPAGPARVRPRPVCPRLPPGRSRRHVVDGAPEHPAAGHGRGDFNAACSAAAASPGAARAACPLIDAPVHQCLGCLLGQQRDATVGASRKASRMPAISANGHPKRRATPTAREATCSRVARRDATNAPTSRHRRSERHRRREPGPGHRATGPPGHRATGPPGRRAGKRRPPPSRRRPGRRRACRRRRRPTPGHPWPATRPATDHRFLRPHCARPAVKSNVMQAARVAMTRLAATIQGSCSARKKRVSGMGVGPRAMRASPSSSTFRRDS